MLGDNLRSWFELFESIVIYRPQASGDHVSNGWLNWADIEGRFKSERLTFCGQHYDPLNEAQRNELLGAIVSYAGILVTCKLLERRRQISPPSLDYRLTKFGRRVSNWGYGTKPGIKKRTLFLALALGLRAYKFRKVVAIGAVGWGILNALKFYAAAASWVESLPFAAWSAVAVAAAVTLLIIIKNMVAGGD